MAMQLAVPPSSGSGYGITFEKGPLAGQQYRLALSVCENPVCQCDRISLDCYSDPGAPSEFRSSDPIRLEMDLNTRAITNLKELRRNRIAYALAISVESEISDEEWAKLNRLFLAAKYRQTEQANLDQIEIHFPPDVLSGHGSMVGYYEILPYARPVVITLESTIWILDDQYCVKAECVCREAVVSLFAETSFDDCYERPVMTEVSFRYAYDTGTINTLLTRSDSGPAEPDLLHALELVQPDLNSFLAKRHALLRRLFQRATAGKAIRLTKKAVGRNDPCPCGSGKKYKRCCADA
jgi:hypothetical protein